MGYRIHPLAAAMAVAFSSLAAQHAVAQSTLNEVVAGASKIRDAATPQQIGAAEIAAQHAITRDTAALAPFMSLIHDPETYENFDKIILIHGVRWTTELAYRDYIEQDLAEHEFFGYWAREKLIYYPTVTREAFRNEGRLTDLIESGKLFADIGQAPLDPETDRDMICGGPAMLNDTADMLNARGFKVSPHIGVAGDYVIERAFVEK